MQDDLGQFDSVDVYGQFRVNVSPFWVTCRVGFWISGVDGSPQTTLNSTHLGRYPGADAQVHFGGLIEEGRVCLSCSGYGATQ